MSPTATPQPAARYAGATPAMIAAAIATHLRSALGEIEAYTEELAGEKAGEAV